MTETLKQLLHDQADDVHFAALDVDRLVRAGERRVRRRGLVAGTGALAALAVVGGVGLTQLGDDDTRSDRGVDAAGGLSTSSVSYARGSVIHAGSRTLEVGHPVRAYVRTSVGYVVADPEGGVWSVTSAGTARVGDADAESVRLVSDTDGTYAGWLEATGEAVFLDQASGDLVSAGDGASQVVELYAVDATTAYWGDAEGAVRADLDTGTVERLDLPGPGQGESSAEILDAEQGALVFQSDGGATFRTPGGAEQFLDQAYGDLGDLSPDGRWYAQDADEAMVFATSDGSRVPLAADHWFAAAMEWLDESRVALIAQRHKSDPVQLLTCTVPAGTCEVSAELAPSFDDLPGDVALPVGEPLED